jgi:hypothetical protein
MENDYPTFWSKADAEMEQKNHVDYLRKWRAGVVEQPKRRDGQEESGLSTTKPWECTIDEGEMIYFLDGWHHATINLEEYTVFVPSFTSEHKLFKHQS